MKLKLLIAPLLVVAIIIMAIWVIAPSYKGLQAQKETLKLTQQKLSNVQEKNRQAAKLRQDFAQSAEQKDLIFKFLPANPQEELLIGNLNSLAIGEGLAVNNLSVAADTGISVPVAPANVNAGAETSVAAPSLATVTINAGVLGPYEKIKSFVNKLSTLKRYNNITAMKISRPASSTSGGTTAPASNLQADITVDFAYLADNNTVVNANSGIFSSGKFDTSVIEQIKNKLSTDIAEISVGATGKANPFLP